MITTLQFARRAALVGAVMLWGLFTMGPAAPAHADDISVCGTLTVSVLSIPLRPLSGCTSTCSFGAGPHNITGPVLVQGWECVTGL